MSKPKHSPGPWEKRHHNTGWAIVDSTGEHLAILFGNEANADLMTAAPDLLEACKKSLVRFQSILDEAISIEEIRDDQKTWPIESLVAALAKAKEKP